MKIPLTKEEKANLRKHNMKIAALADLSTAQAAVLIETSNYRAKILQGLIAFQRVPSIGLQLADKMVHYLGVYSLDDLKGADAAEWFDELEVRLGVWTDACVEDQIRCLIHHVDHPGSTKRWHDFTTERKAYREQYGYPATRPRKAWYETGDENVDVSVD